MKRLLLLAVMATLTLGSFAQNKSTVTIQTNASRNCQKCETRFKDNVPFFKGVKEYTYDKATAKLTVTYDAKKTSPEQLRKQISDLGYNADNVAANAAVRAKLPACCRTEKMGGCCSSSGEQKCHQ